MIQKMLSYCLTIFPRTKNLNNLAALVIWIVLYHNLFYSGSTEGMPKSGFLELIYVSNHPVM